MVKEKVNHWKGRNPILSDTPNVYEQTQMGYDIQILLLNKICNWQGLPSYILGFFQEEEL